MSGSGGGKPAGWEAKAAPKRVPLKDEEVRITREQLNKYIERIRQLEDELFEVTVLVPPVPEPEIKNEDRQQ